jgi:hypothetical protein
MNPILLILLSMTTLVAGCDAIVGIFEAGAWFGIVIAVIVIALVLGLFGLFRRK